MEEKIYDEHIRVIIIYYCYYCYHYDIIVYNTYR